MDNNRRQSEINRSYITAARVKECFHHQKDECKGKIKQAHSIQKNGKLSILESDVNGNKSVYSFAHSRISYEHMMNELIPIGKKEASTFYGFCDFHDSKLFSKIENFAFDDSDEHLFLHSYRSFAHSYHLKNEEIRAWNDVEYQKILIDTYGQKDVKVKQRQFKALEKHLKSRKKILDDSLTNDEFNNLNYLIFKFDGIVPLAIADIITPSVSFSGKLMNNSDDGNLIVSQPIITLLPEKDYSFLIIAAFNIDELSTNYLDEINAMPKYKYEKALSSIIIDSCQNTVISPKFWDKLPSGEKRLILDEYSIKSIECLAKGKIFWTEFNFFNPKYFIN